MHNRKIIFTAAATIALAAAIHFHSSKKVGAPHPSSIANSETTPEKQKPFSTPIPQAVNSLTDPADRALAQLRNLFAQDPSDENGHAAEFLNDLCRTNQFQLALKLIDTVPRDLRTDWLKIIFNRWAQTEPSEAIKSLATIADPEEHTAAFESAVAGWNSTDPAGLANYAINLTTPDDRDYALSAALNNWSLQDPTALATWLNTLPRGAEFDYGAALMISKTDGANRAPELAMKWVENIEDPALKQNSFTRVLTEWMQTDSAAAKQYVSTAAWLDDPFRSKLLSTLSPTSP